MAGAKASRNVLIVEDDAMARACLARLLEHYGWEVVSAGTVAEGLAGLAKDPDYVFLDLMLPDGEGTEVLERVRMGNMAARVIVVSGVTDRGMLRRAAVLRPDAMMGKPMDFMEVLELMKPAA